MKHLRMLAMLLLACLAPCAVAAQPITLPDGAGVQVATIITNPHTYVNGELLTPAILNPPLSTVYNWANGNVDHFNIGANGIYASQIIPTSAGQATFGGAVAYTFANGLNVSGGSLNVGAGVAGSAGDIALGRTTTTADLYFGTTATLDFGITNPGIFSFNKDVNLSVANANLKWLGNTVLTSDGATQATLIDPASTASLIVGSSLAKFNVGISAGNGAGATGTSRLFAGTGAPVFSAPNGSLFLRFDGGAGARLYLNTSGASTSGVTWTAEL